LTAALPAAAFGSQLKLGLMVIHNDGVPETEMRMLAPPGVGIYVARFQSPRRKGSDYRGDLVQACVESADIRRAAEMLGSMPLDYIGLAYASGCLVEGLRWDEAVTAHVTEIAGGVPSVGAATAIVAAAHALGLKSPLVVVPAWFSDSLVTSATEFAAGVGLGPDAVLRADMGPEWNGMEPHAIYDGGGGWKQDPSQLERSILSSISSSADGVVIVGGGLRAAELIPSLEARLSRAVVTAQQALLWYCLRSRGVDVRGEARGRLFACALPVKQTQEA
jgi:maleate isomerase